MRPHPDPRPAPRPDPHPARPHGPLPAPPGVSAARRGAAPGRRRPAEHGPAGEPEGAPLACLGSAVPSDPALLAEVLGGLQPWRAGPGFAREQARVLLARFGSLRALAGAHPAELEGPLQLGRRAAERLAAAFALGRRAASEPLRRGAALTTTAQVHAAYGPLLRGLRKELLLALHLDAKGRVVREERISEGTLQSSPAHPREVFGSALRQGAAGLILLHNHPSGDPEPSPEDVAATHRLAAVGELVGIRLLDHLVIGDGRFVSMLERGEIPTS